MNEAELRASRARMEAATHAARRRIERSLHDGPQQHLVALAVKLRLAESAIDDDPAQAKATLVELRAEVQDTIQHLRDVAYQIYPPLLADRGLGEALSSASGRAETDVNVTVAGDGNRRYPSEVEAAVYFNVLDAIQAAAGELSVWVGEEEGQLLFEVWGPLDEGPVLLDIADRTDTLGGKLVVESTDDGGLHLRGAIPV